MLADNLMSLAAKTVKADAIFVHCQSYMWEQMIKLAADSFRSSGVRIIGLNGHEHYKPGSHGFDYWKEQLIRKHGIPENVIRRTENADHTGEEAEEFMKMAKNENITSAIVATTPEHLFRAFLTDLGAMKAAGLNLALHPLTVSSVKWTDRVEYWSVVGVHGSATYLGKFAGECARVAAYRERYEKGDKKYVIASVEEGIQFLNLS